MALRTIRLVALAAFLSAGIVRADDAPKLPGINLKTEDAVSKADTIFVGQITHISSPVFKMAGVDIYFGTQARILKVLLGSFDRRSTFTLYVIATANFHEEPPKAGSSYIVFARKNSEGQPDPYIGMKLLPATDANIAIVKTLISN